MPVTNPAGWLRARTDHPASLYRRLLNTIYATNGIINVGDLAVTAAGGMTVSVAPGEAIIAGSLDARQGKYFCPWDGPPTTLTLAASDPVNPRIDLICAKVQDSEYAGSVDAWSVVAAAGTPAAAPVVPARPASSIPLARVSVPANSTIVGPVTDMRWQAARYGGHLLASGDTIEFRNAPAGQNVTLVSGRLIVPEGATPRKIMFDLTSPAAGPALIGESVGDWDPNAPVLEAPMAGPADIGMWAGWKIDGNFIQFGTNSRQYATDGHAGINDRSQHLHAATGKQLPPGDYLFELVAGPLQFTAPFDVMSGPYIVTAWY